MPQLDITTRLDNDRCIVATIFPTSEKESLAAGTSNWTEAIQVATFDLLDCELIASSIPADTIITIQTSRFQFEPSQADWFDEDSYTWDVACNSFKYQNFPSDARWYRVKIDVGASGDLTDLAFCIGAKNQ